MRGLQVKDGIVDNVAVFEIIPVGWIDCPDGVGIGWTDNSDGTFSPPVVIPDPISESEQIRINKLEGILFEGVMYSVTKEDMWGLKAIEDDVAGGLMVPFEFDNGNILVLTSANFAAFRAVWVPFRASFFSVPT